MQSAASRLSQVVCAHLKASSRVLVLAGKGSNGSDALMAAAMLHARGIGVTVWVDPSRPAETMPSLITSRRDLEPQIDTEQKPNWLEDDLRRTLVLDGLLGLGTNRVLDSKHVYHHILASIAAAGPQTVVAIDLPSGLVPDQIEQSPPQLPADVTVTFGARKLCHCLAPSLGYCGRVIVEALQFDPKVASATLGDSTSLMGTTTKALVNLRPWQSLAADSHKYQRGHILILGGSPGKTGAVTINAEAALKAGAGWVTVATQAQSRDLPLAATSSEFFEGDSLREAELLEFIKDRKVRVIVIGSGLTSNPLSAELCAGFDEIGASRPFTVILDAGGLHDVFTILPKITGAANWLLLPHPGEYQKLGHNLEPLSSLAELQRANEQFAERGLYCLHKSATPILLGQLGKISFVMETCVALAQAGTGDTLAGVCAGIAASGCPLPTAALSAQLSLIAAAKAAAARRGGAHPVLAEIIDSLAIS